VHGAQHKDIKRDKRQRKWAHCWNACYSTQSASLQGSNCKKEMRASNPVCAGAEGQRRARKKINWCPLNCGTNLGCVQSGNHLKMGKCGQRRRAKSMLIRESGSYKRCTSFAGMGRAPAVALAYMWWVQGLHLEDAHELLLSKRSCHPKLSSIREAAADMLYSGNMQEVTIRKKGTSFSSTVEIAGSCPLTPTITILRS
jgi:hypothetical protein